ncbi:Acyl-CoA desaturase [Grifola frondosa]|uniref:Acyl-CoA desaturase n=1 Tax=Grifola frondosa TaxID=5627 RepID=A0A1C7LXF6_GRIFR|nr:Acyl-CoA desaturase [Grifola frondosa]
MFHIRFSHRSMNINRPLQGFPPIKGIEWSNLSILLFTHAVALYGIIYVPLQVQTLACAAVYYIFSTLGYHRLWSHRAFKASLPLQWFLILAGASAVQGSCYWWAQRHRSHHRYTDTDKDPYNSKRGLLWTHMGWVIFRTDIPPGGVDTTDLCNNVIVQWQRRWFFFIGLTFGYVIPTVVPGLFWSDWKGGLCFVASLRMTVCHHLLVVEGLIICQEHILYKFHRTYIGSTPYDDKHSPRNHFLTAILTMGEGYHNFHHQFPMDYRNAFRWYQFDPTKWFIAACGYIGLATHLREFPTNEVEKGAFTMKIKELKVVQDSLKWPVPVRDLPVVSWETFQERSRTHTLILVSGFIHDASDFLVNHPGGAHILDTNSGKDMTASFFGGILAMMRVGILAGGVECLGEHAIPPSQRLFIEGAD